MARPSATVRDIAALLIGGALLLLPGLGAIDLFNPDEPREAEIAREMGVTHDYVVPRFNGCPFLEKPPLFYWKVLEISRIPGLSRETAVRLPSVLAALGLLLVTYFIGREIDGRRTGRAGAFLLLTTYQFWWLGRRGLLDMLLAFFVGATLLFFMLAGERPAVFHRLPRRAGWLLLAAAAATGAALTKGLIGLVIPALTIAVWLSWRRQPRRLLDPALVAAALLPIAALGVWITLLAIRPDGSCYLREFLIENHVRRFFGGGYAGHEQPPWYYLEALLTDFEPWVLFLPAAVIGLWPGLWRGKHIGLGSPESAAIGADSRGAESGAKPAAVRGSREQDGGTASRGGRDPGRFALLHAWLLPALVVLSIASTKRGLYLLPLAPAIAILVAGWWRSRAARAKLAVLVPASLLLVLGVLVSVALPFAFAALTTGETPRRASEAISTLARAPSGIPAGAALLVAVLLVGLVARRAPRRGAGAAVLLAWVVFSIAGVALLPLASPRVSARRFGEAIREERAAGARIAACGLKEGALGQFLFYAGGTLEWIGRADRAVENSCVDCPVPGTAAEFLTGGGRRACLLLEDEFERLPAELRRGRILARGRIGGASYVLVRTGTPR